MSAITRREFVKSAAAAALLFSDAIDLRSSPLGLPIGCQTWPVRDMIAKDFPGTIQKLARIGIFVWSGDFYAVDLIERLGLKEKGGVVRIGFVHYNTSDEVDRVLQALQEILSVPRAEFL